MGVSESVHFMQCMTFLTPSWCQSTAGRLLYCIFSQSSPRVFWHRPKAIRWEVSISAGSLHQPKKAQTRRSSCTTSRWWSNKWWGRIGHGAFLWLHCPKGKLDNTLWPCCLAKEKNTPMRWKMQWERERDEVCFAGYWCYQVWKHQVLQTPWMIETIELNLMITPGDQWKWHEQDENKENWKSLGFWMCLAGKKYYRNYVVSFLYSCQGPIRHPINPKKVWETTSS